MSYASLKFIARERRIEKISSQFQATFIKFEGKSFQESPSKRMNHLNVNSDPSFLQLPDSLTTSPSQSTFMAEEDASICPLLHNTSSSQLINHPLTPSPGIPTDNSEYSQL